jgi:hypothetical protein
MTGNERKQLFAKWRKWLRRIKKEQLSDLLINRHIFRQFCESTKPYAGESTKPYAGQSRGAELAAWMEQCYVAYATTTVRRMTEEPKKTWQSISLSIFLDDLLKNRQLVTRDYFCSRHGRSPSRRYADAEFSKIAGAGRPCLSEQTIKQDKRSLKKACDKVRKLVNKIIAHTENDRRKWPRVLYGDIDSAIDELNRVFDRYWYLLTATHPAHEPLDDCDVTDDLQKLWPPV